MDKTCLKTTFGVSVNNPNLKVFNHIILDCVSASNNFVKLACAANFPALKVTLLSGTIDHATSGVTVTDSTHCVINAGAGNTGFFTPNANQVIKIDIEDFYGISIFPEVCSTSGADKLNYLQFVSLSIKNPSSTLDLEAFASFTKCTSLELRDTGNKLTGDLSFIIGLALTNFLYMSAPATIPVKLSASDFSSITSLKTLILEDNKIPTLNGDLATLFGSLTELTTLRIAGTSIQGTVESFVAAQIAAGRSTCTGIVIGRNMAGATFNGSTISGSASKTLSWTSASNITIA